MFTAPHRLLQMPSLRMQPRMYAFISLLPTISSMWILSVNEKSYRRSCLQFYFVESKLPKIIYKLPGKCASFYGG